MCDGELVRSLFALLPAEAQYSYVSEAMIDICSFLYYYAIQWEVKKPCLWDQLTEQEKQDMAPADLEKFVRETSSGWRALLPAGTPEVFLKSSTMLSQTSDVRKLEGRAEDLLRKLVTKGPSLFGEGYGQVLLLLEPLAVKSEVKEEPSPETCRGIETSLLQPWPYSPPRPGEQMHWGAVLHGLVQGAATAFGVSWPRHVVILCTSAAETLDLLQLQVSASWCAPTSTGQWHSQNGDGLKEPGVQREMEAFMQHLTQRWPGPFSLKEGPCLPQQDSWSCGHRVCCSTRKLSSNGVSARTGLRSYRCGPAVTVP